MEKENIYAYTAPGCNYPEFVSVNREENGDVKLIVRGKPKDGKCGETVSITIDGHQALLLADALSMGATEHLRKKG